jgi:activating signal cointegrator complex subunit 3
MLIEETLELPRLTGTLRTYSSLSKKFNDFDLDIDKTLLKKRKELIANKNIALSSTLLPNNNINWTNLVSKLIPNINDIKYSKLKSYLDKLRLSISKQFLNEDFNDSAILNEASLFIIESFYEFRNINNHSSSSNFQNIDKIIKKLKEKFGQFPRNTFDACKELMESIFSELTNLNRLDILNETFLKRTITDESSSFVISETYFGENIKFSSFYDDDNFKLNVDLESCDEESDFENSSSENEEIEFNFLNEPTNQQSTQELDASKYIDWTKDTPNQISTIVYELLSKNTNSNELQNELAELLGFEKIELVEYLLTNRVNVVNAYKLYLIDNVVGDNLSSLPTIRTSAIRQNKSSSNSLPTISSEITVHTETEKKIKKQIRKEEKKLTKYNKMPTNSSETSNDLDNFDPVSLRQLREEQLQEARVLQLYHQKKMSCLLPPTKSSLTDQYPYVFDSMLKIAQTSAFIAGSKILLPESIRRMDTNQFEEVFIPPSESLEQVDKEKFKGQKEEICLRPLIRIEDLDQIGQIAFRNIKTLNRIQSIVFDEAYNTNQNLLICAPTGAGKTNIAMLTIVNQIKKNFIDGVLRKDEFKIVYIAPMKALAAEMVDNFSKRLEQLGIVVRELTGDMQLTKQEILQTQILVTTPEKWDVVTRKSLGDTSLSLLVKLLIIDEVCFK